MINRKIMAVLIITMVVGIWSCKKETKPKVEEAVIVSFQGEVSISSNGQDWTKVSGNNVKIKKNDWVSTGSRLGSMVKIQVWNGSLVMLSKDSKIQILELNEKQQFEIKLQNGQMSNQVQKLVDEGYYRVYTQSFMAGVRGTEFDVVVQGDKERLLVNGGAVAVRRNIEDSPERLLKAGQAAEFSVTETEKLKKKVASLMGKDREKELDIPVRKIGDIEKELPEDMKKELREQRKFIKKSSAEIDKTVEEKSKEIEKTVEKQSKEVENLEKKTFEKDATDMTADELLKSRKKNTTTTTQDPSKPAVKKRPSLNLDLDKATE